jgi:phosphonate ABC transporter substrate-binding protein
LRARAAALALLLLSTRVAASPDVALFDPDANLANVAQLRSVVGSFLRTIDDGARFLPFGKPEDLRKYMGETGVEFVLLNTLYAAELGNFRLRPVLIPLREGDTTYHKVLLVRRGTDLAEIKVVATTSPPAEVEAISVRGRGLQKVLVLRVSKGIDALLGMAFDRADAAYVTPETVSALASVDPDLAASLAELYRSPAIPNPQLYVVGDVPAGLVRKVVEAFRAMDRTEAGRAVLRTLNYTGWRTP